MAPFDTFNLDSDQQNQSQLHDTNATTQRGQPLSFAHGSLTSDSGGGRRSSSCGVAVAVVGSGGQETQLTGTNWEATARDLSRRPNIHRSHLSSSIQTGTSSCHG